MYFDPAETIDRPTIADTFIPAPQVQPNTPAPIAVYQGNMQWLTPRNMAIAIGGVVMAAILIVASRGTGNTQTQSMTIYPPEVEPVDQEKVDINIVKNNISKLPDVKQATDLKIEEIQQASINERSQEILLEAQRQVKDTKSGCYRAFNGTKCYPLLFIKEQQRRYQDAISVREWNKANNALFDIKSARIALDGIKQDVPLNPAITSAAIFNEVDLRMLIEDQSQNATATDMYQGVRKKK